MNKNQQKNKKNAFQLSKEGVEFVQKEMKRYETKRSAVIPCLYRVQTENNGWVSPECVAYLSQLMDISESCIYEALTFYTMFNKKPTAPLHVQVCCNVTCAMKGSRELLQKLKNRFSLPQQKNSAAANSQNDQKTEPSVTFTPVECLGSCDTAPVAQINREPYLEKLTVEKAIQILENKIN